MICHGSSRCQLGRYGGHRNVNLGGKGRQSGKCEALARRLVKAVPNSEQTRG